VNVTVCTHACDRPAYDARLYDMAAQLAAVTVERDRLAAQVSRLQDALGVAQEGYEVYYGMYKDLSAKEARR